jgi:ferredoxin--NADP+ reductase
MPDPADPYNARIVEKRLLHDTLGVFRIAYEGADVPDFEPGQFTNLALLPPAPAGGAADPAAPTDAPDEGVRRRRRRGPRLVRRAYSICSPPSEKRWLEFYIVAVDEGALTPRVFDLGVGGRLFMDTKIKGHFTLDGVPPGRDLVTVATGTGIAPFLSMYQQYREQDRWDRFVFIHGVRYAKDLGYRDELTAFAAQDPRVTYLPVVSREPKDAWDGLHGRVSGLFRDGVYERLVGVPLDPRRTHVFLCGNPAMIDELEAELTADGGPGFVTKTPRQKDGNLHFERYW